MTRKEKTDKLRSIRRWLLDILIIIAGSGVYALGVHCFTAPNNIAPGGVTGIATIISFVTDLNVGTLIAAINVPLLIAGFVLLNKRTMIKTLVSVAALSVMTDYLFKDIPVYIADNGGGILASIFGGLLMGAGIGIVYVREGTTGGTDIVNKIINRFRPEIKLGQISFLVNAAVAVSGYIVYKNLDVVMYAIIAVFVQAKVIDVLVYGGLEGKFLMIFSEKPHEISEKLLKQKLCQDIQNGVRSSVRRARRTAQEQRFLQRSAVRSSYASRRPAALTPLTTPDSTPSCRRQRATISRTTTLTVC